MRASELIDILTNLEDDDVEVRVMDGQGYLIEVTSVQVGPVVHNEEYGGYIVDKEDYGPFFEEDTFDAEDYEFDLANAEPMVVLIGE